MPTPGAATVGVVIEATVAADSVTTVLDVVDPTATHLVICETMNSTCSDYLPSIDKLLIYVKSHLLATVYLSCTMRITMRTLI